MVNAFLISVVHFAVTVSLAALLLLFVFRRSPVPVVRSCFLGLRQDPGIRAGTSLFVVLVLAHLLFVILQKKISFGGFWQLTPVLAELEGKAHAFAFDLPLLFNLVFCFSYFFVFTALPLVIFHVLDFTNHRDDFIDFLAALNICLAVCLVSFVLFEANEVWTTFPEAPLFIHGDLCKTLLNMRSLNYVGNCFPSLHVAFMTICCHSAFRLGFPRLLLVVIPLAALVVLATLCLVIHWYLDVIAGAALGLACSCAAHRLKIGRLNVDFKG